jgi:predicted kinase
LHDIAKPYSTQIEGGRLRSRHHSPRGAVHARWLLWEAGLPPSERAAVCGIVRHRQLPLHGASASDCERRISAASFRCKLSHLALPAAADILGRVCSDRREKLDEIELFRAYALELGGLDAPRGFPSDHRRLSYFREGRPAGVLAYDDTKLTVTVMSGLPGSLKTHWVSAKGCEQPVVSLDVVRTQLGIAASGDQGPVRHAAREFLRRGADFVWGATHLQAPRRERTIALLRSYRARVEIVAVATSPERLWRQNRDHPHPVPNAVLRRMIERWEAPDLTEAHAVSWVGDVEQRVGT